MASQKSMCAMCESNDFEAAQLRVQGLTDGIVLAIQCAECGAVVGVLDSAINADLIAIKRKIGII